VKVLALVTEAYGGHGGIAQAARDMIAAIAAQTSVTHVDVLPRHAAKRPDGIPANVHQLAPVPGRIRYGLRAVTLAWRRRPDIIFCTHLFMAPLALWAARLAAARLVVQLHGIEIWRSPKPLQRRALEAADMLLCVSRDTRARALAWADLPPERAFVLNNTVAPDFTPGDRAQARAKFGLGDERVLLTVGRLNPGERYKGYDRVIGALNALKASADQPLLYILAGEGDDLERLQQIAQAAGVSEQVRFLGKVPPVDLPDLYRAADFFVLPSTGEGFGIVFLEAMACGTPALGLAAGGAPDALGDGELGYMVSPEVDFTVALQAALDASKPGSRALAHSVQSRFSNNVFQQQLAAALNSLHPANA
jgi:phosphatidylinositol alpha-1,6-mannosyltransferase